MSTPRTIRAATGSELTCKGWVQEAALRMLMNNLDPDVAERPQDLVVYGGTGKAARNWECFDVIVRELRELASDETLLVQSGKAVGRFRTHEGAPRVLIANSNLVPAWANWPTFRKLEAEGLTMYGQMTAGSWIYIGTQGILQGTYETFVAAKKAFEKRTGNPARWLLTAGLGGMGGAQPLAATMAGISCLAVEIDASRIDKRIATRYVDERADTLDAALERIERATQEGKPVSVGLLGNAGDIYTELVARNIVPDLVTEQTSAHDPLNGYVPMGFSLEEGRRAAPRGSGGVRRAGQGQHGRRGHRDAAAEEGWRRGLRLRQQHSRRRGRGRLRARVRHPGFVPAYIRPLFCEGKGPFRWVALSGDPEDIAVTDAAVLEMVPNDSGLRAWLELAKERVQFQGLPSRICWLGYGDRHRVGLKFNELVATGKVKAPIVIGRDHLDCGSVASPNRETEAMKDGSDAIADFAILNALVNTAAGASWVSFHHGGGVGMGMSLHAGMVVVADGTDGAAQRLEVDRARRTEPRLPADRRQRIAGDRRVRGAAALEHRGVRPG